MNRILQRLAAIRFGDDKPGAPATTPIEPHDHERATRSALSLVRPLTIGWLLLVFGFGGFAIWAVFAPLDQGVSAPGAVVVTGYRKVVQHLQGGIVAKVLVREGDSVKSGQTLVRMDTTAAASQLEAVKAQWITSRAMEARLSAERDASASVIYPSDLLQDRNQPAVREAMQLQTRLFETRRSALQAELAVLSETIVGLEAQIRGTEASRTAKEEQLKLLALEVRNQRELADGGYLPRNRLSEQERLLAQLTGALSEDVAMLGRSRSAIAELKLRQLSRQQDFRHQVEAHLSDAQRDVNSLDGKIRLLKFDLGNTDVKAPADGVVMNLTIHTEGGVVQGGAPLMEIVPFDEPLRVDVQIPLMFIDKVRPGLPVDVLFPAFNQKFTPNVPGVLTKISADAIADSRSNSTYYRGEVNVTPEGIRKLREHRIKAGMPAEVFIRTGERTALNYVVKPLRDRIFKAMTEE